MLIITNDRLYEVGFIRRNFSWSFPINNNLEYIIQDIAKNEFDGYYDEKTEFWYVNDTVKFLKAVEDLFMENREQIMPMEFLLDTEEGRYCQKNVDSLDFEIVYGQLKCWISYRELNVPEDEVIWYMYDFDKKRYY